MAATAMRENTVTAAEAEADDTTATPTVLVIAEKPFMRVRSAAQLREHGYTVVEVEAMRDAARLYASARPQAVLLDGSTMEAQGLKALRALMTLDPAARVAIVVSQPTHGTVLEAARLGALDVVAKPFDASRLLRAIQTLVAPPTERQYVRVPVTLDASIAFGATVGAYHPCVIEDLSAGGARCRLARLPYGGNPGAGTVAQLRFMLPDGQGMILVVGRMVRSIAPGVLGLAFVRMSGTHSERIKAFCQQVLEQNAAIAAGSPANRAAQDKT